MFPVWAEAWSDHCVWLLSSLKRLSWKVSTWRFCQSPSGLNWILLKKNPIKRFLLWPFFGRGQTEHQEKHLTFDLRAACGHWVRARAYNKATYCTSFSQHGCHTRNTPLPHTHTLHPHVDRNTHSRNNVTSKTGYRWLQWWETSNDLRKKKNVIFMCDLCKRSAVLFLLTEAQLYFWYPSL